MEEIIIDGVKVEECSYYNKDNTPYCCEVWDNECEAQNCYYKQLKHLEQENARLKEEIKEIKKYQYQQEYLDKEIEEMQKALKTLAEGLNKRQMLLQEIKKYIAKICKEECGYVQKKRCPDCDCRFGAILDLITKAEEE